jgi:hypothetical protein
MLATSYDGTMATIASGNKVSRIDLVARIRLERCYIEQRLVSLANEVLATRLCAYSCTRRNRIHSLLGKPENFSVDPRCYGTAACFT